MRGKITEDVERQTRTIVGKRADSSFHWARYSANQSDLRKWCDKERFSLERRTLSKQVVLSNSTYSSLLTKSGSDKEREMKTQEHKMGAEKAPVDEKQETEKRWRLY